MARSTPPSCTSAGFCIKLIVRVTIAAVCRSVIAHVDHGESGTLCFVCRIRLSLCLKRLCLLEHLEGPCSAQPVDSECCCCCAGKSTLTDSLVAAAGIIAMEAVSACLQAA